MFGGGIEVVCSVGEDGGEWKEPAVRKGPSAQSRGFPIGGQFLNTKISFIWEIFSVPQKILLLICCIDEFFHRLMESANFVILTPEAEREIVFFGPDLYATGIFEYDVIHDFPSLESNAFEGERRVFTAGMIDVAGLHYLRFAEG